MEHFDIVKSVVKYQDKVRCGDACLVLDMPTENILVLLVADGVGGSACDWKASETSCEAFIKSFENNTTITDLPARIKQAIQFANNEVESQIGTCAGMKSTFLVVIWEYKSQKIYYASIGDSRIYKIYQDTWTQITTDETKTVIRRGKDGKPLNVGGAIITAEGVTNLMGALGDYTIQELDGDEVEGIVLATDGFYMGANFEQEIMGIFEDLDMEEKLNKLLHFYKDNQKDDMTLVIARKKLLEIPTNKKLSKNEQTQEMLINIEEAFTAHDDALSSRLLTLCHEKSLRLGHKNMIALLDKMHKIGFHDVNSYQLLIKMLRRNQ